MKHSQTVSRFRIAILILGFLLSTSPISARDKDQKSKMLLVINANINPSPWSGDFIPQGAEMMAYHLNVEVFSESMNMMLINSTEDLNAFKNYLFEKYTQNPDALLLLGASTQMLLEDIRTHWGDIPMILCSEESYAAPDESYLHKKPAPSEQRTPTSLLTRKYNLTHLVAPIQLEETIKLMQTMTPAMERLILLTDNAPSSRHIEADLRMLMQTQYPQITLEIFEANQTATRPLIDYLRHLNPNTTGILMSSWYYITHRAYSQSIETTLLTLVTNTQMPIYALRNSALHKGKFFGGYTINQKEYNTHLVNVLIDILDGIPARDIPLYYPNNARARFNYDTIQALDIDIKTIPLGAQIIDLPPTYWQAHRYQMIATLLFLLFGIVFVFLQRKRIIALNKLREAEHKELELMAEHRDLIRCMPITYARGKIVYNKNDIPTDVMILDVNPAFRQVFPDLGQPEGHRIGELFPLFVHTMLTFMRRINDKNPSCVIPFYAENRRRFFEIIISRTSNSEMLDLFCIDCTDLHQTQEELALTNHKLSMSIEVSNITPWKWNLTDRTILYDVNKSSDTQPDEHSFAINDELYFSRIHAEDRERIRNAYTDLMEDRISKLHEEYRIQTHNSTEAQIDWIEVKAAVDQRDKNGQPQTIIGSSLIITKRKAMEHELVRAMERAEESNRIKSAFLTNMSHEIRTPLNAIVGFSAMLADADTQEERSDYLTIIRKNNELLLQLIGDILDLSKIEAGTLDFPYSDVDLNQLMFEVEGTMQIRQHNSAVELSFDNAETNLLINTSSNRLAQVLINLLSNSIKFTEQGAIHFGYSLDENMIRFYVTDTGCGIPEDKRHKIFERFVKLNNFEQGTGLGLAICQTIIEYMGGQIGVDSRTGEGATFWFTIPYRPAESV